MVSDVNFHPLPVEGVLFRFLLCVAELGVLRRTILCAGELPARRERLAGAVRADERDIRIDLSVAPLLMDDGDFGGATDQILGVEIRLLGCGERTSEPLLEELCECRLFVKRRGKSPAPHAERRTVLAEHSNLEDKFELLLRAERCLHGSWHG